MPESIQEVLTRTQLTFREWDVLWALMALPVHPYRYSPARIGRKLELPPSEIDAVLKDLHRRKILMQTAWSMGRRRWTVWRQNPLTSQWLPPQPKPPMARLIERFLTLLRGSNL
jgi:hypothetical protein